MLRHRPGTSRQARQDRFPALCAFNEGQRRQGGRSASMAPPVSEKLATKPGNSAHKGSCRQVTHPNQRQAFMDLADRSAGAARSRGYGPAVLFAKPVARHADDGTSGSKRLMSIMSPTTRTKQCPSYSGWSACPWVSSCFSCSRASSIS